MLQHNFAENELPTREITDLKTSLSWKYSKLNLEDIWINKFGGTGDTSHNLRVLLRSFLCCSSLIDNPNERLSKMFNPPPTPTSAKPMKPSNLQYLVNTTGLLNSHTSYLGPGILWQPGETRLNYVRSQPNCNPPTHLYRQNILMKK